MSRVKKRRSARRAEPILFGGAAPAAVAYHASLESYRAHGNAKRTPPAQHVPRSKLHRLPGTGSSATGSRLRLRLLGYSATRLLGYSATRLLGYSATRLLGYSATRLLGYSATRLLGYSATRLLGYSATAYRLLATGYSAPSLRLLPFTSAPRSGRGAQPCGPGRARIRLQSRSRPKPRRRPNPRGRPAQLLARLLARFQLTPQE